MSSERSKNANEPPEPPDDETVKSLIDVTAFAVAKKGKQEEDILKKANKNNPRYDFLSEHGPFNTYYQFKVLLHKVELSKKRGRKRVAVDTHSEPSTSTRVSAHFLTEDVPDDLYKRAVLESLASAVHTEGNRIEEALKMSERENPLYSFLFGGEGSKYYKFMLSVEAVESRRRQKKIEVDHHNQLHNALDNNTTIALQPGPPVQEDLKKLIESVAERVVLEGNENQLKEKELENPLFSFMFGGDHHQYYKYCVALKEVEIKTHRKQYHDLDKRSYAAQPRKKAAVSSSSTVKQATMVPAIVGQEMEKCLTAGTFHQSESDMNQPHMSARVEEMHLFLEDFEITEKNTEQLEPAAMREIEEVNRFEEYSLEEHRVDEVEAHKENNFETDSDEEICGIQTPQRSFKKLNEIMPNFKKTITQQPSGTPAEIMNNMLILSKIHNWSATEQSHVMMLVNSIFNEPVVPDSRHLLDEYLVCSQGTSYHFYCDACYKLFKNVDIGVIKQLVCDDCRKEYVISDLSKSKFFVTLDVRLELQNLLKNSKVCEALQKFFSSERYLGSPDGVLRDLYDGAMYQNFRLQVSKETIPSLKDLSFTLCTDGTPLYKSSNCSIWPLFYMVNELSPKLRFTNLLLGGLWFGNSKPKMNVFLQPVVDHLRELRNGFRIEVCHGLEWCIRAHNISCCVDSGARGSVQGIHAHNGKFGCNFCLHPGVGVGPARYYPMLEVPPQERSMQEIIEDAVQTRSLKQPVNGVLGITCLAGAPLFDIVSGMILDHLHNFNLGVGRQFTKAWFGADGAKVHYYVAQPINLELINSRIKMLKPSTEVRKYQRPASALSYWSGLEWENWILYFSIPVKEGILRQEYLKHWAKFVQAARLLLQMEVTEEDIDKANELLTRFVSDVELLYCTKEDFHHMTFNVHLLLHAAKNVRKWGPQWAISAYAFEAGNGRLKKIIHANRGIASQVCRSISQSNAAHILEVACKKSSVETFRRKIDISHQKMKEICVGKLKFLGYSSHFQFGEEEKWLLEQAACEPEDFRSYAKVVSDGTVFGVDTWQDKKRKTNNSFASTSDGTVVKINGIILREDRKVSYAITNRVRCFPHNLALPDMTSEASAFLLCVEGIDIEKKLLSLSQLKSKFLSIDVGNGHYLSKIVYRHNTV